MFNIKAAARKWPVGNATDVKRRRSCIEGGDHNRHCWNFPSEQRRRLLSEDMCMRVDCPHVAHFTTRKMPRVRRARSASLPQPVHGRKPLLQRFVWAINEPPLADFRTLT